LKKSLNDTPGRAAKLYFQNGFLVTKPFFEKFQKVLQSKLHIVVNSEAAVDMYRAILAIHNKLAHDKIRGLLDKVFKMKAYQLSNEAYTTVYPDEDSKVSLNEFENFLIHLSEGEILTQGNFSLQLIASNYVDAIMNPGKYLLAIEEYNSIPISFYEDALKKVEKWLPSKTDGEKVFIWLLFDMKQGMSCYKNNIFIDIFSCVDKKGNVNKDLFFHAVSYGIFLYGYGNLDSFKKKIDYYNLPNDSKLKMFTYFMDMSIREGLPEKVCLNTPGIISNKVRPNEPTFWINDYYRKTWEHFQSNSLQIFDKAKSDLRNILTGKIDSFDDLIKKYGEYWLYYDGKYTVSEKFIFGRRYYLGSEIMGVIYDAYGKKGVEEAASDLLKTLPMFNKALLKTKPKNYKKYLFPDDIINLLNEKFLSKIPAEDSTEITPNEQAKEKEDNDVSEKKDWIKQNVGIL
jgi:hypothetical protein